MPAANSVSAWPAVPYHATRPSHSSVNASPLIKKLAIPVIGLPVGSLFRGENSILHKLPRERTHLHP